MKVCESCGNEIDTKDGENKCGACEREIRNTRQRARRRANRAAMQAVMESCGLVKVRGALGGIYYE